MRNIHQYSRYLGLALLLLLTGAFAQSDSDTSAQENPQFSQQELDQMLAPIALYPDALLSQVLMAATYPLEVVEAARWSRENAGLKDREAVDAVGEKDWDPSVKSLVAFPQVLAVMDDKIEWTERLGDAFLAQQSQVMDTVQSLRRKAQSAGNLRTNAQVDVQQDGEDVEIAPVNAEVAFVPYYDPSVVYGPWWWPDYQPVLWGPWAGYDWNGGLAWGIGIGIGADFFFGSWDWPRHHIYVRDHGHGFPPRGRDGQPLPGRTWQHDPDHRRGVPYRNGPLQRQFGHARAPDTRNGYRGREGSAISRPAPAPRSTSPSAGRIGGYAQPNSPLRRESFAEPHPHAFEDIGRGAEVRGFSERGRSSFQGAAPRQAPASRPAPPRRGR